jgi:hypothetical protein
MTTDAVVLATLARAGVPMTARVIAAATSLPIADVKATLRVLATEGKAERDLYWGERGLSEKWVAAR